MPELPEVEIIVKGLKKEIVGKVIEDVEVTSDYKISPTTTVFSNENFIRNLKDQTVQNAERLAKVIIIKLSNKNFLSFHLAMTGRILFRNKNDKQDNHLRILIRFTDNTEIRFTDVRMFGWAKIFSEDEIETFKTKYGPTPFDENIKPEHLIEKVEKRKVPIKKLLLEQDFLAGVGNIYANDALWMSKIHPLTPANYLVRKEWEVLIQNLKKILTEGIEHGGSTLNDFVDIYGNPGTHQNYFRVYSQENKPCKNCQTAIAYEEVGGRSTFYCPTCQLIKKTASQNLSLW